MGVPPLRLVLAELTTLGVGGPAGAFVEVERVDDLVEALSRAATAGEPVLVLGGGSNVVVSDDGFPGVVLRIDIRGVQMQDDGDGAVTVTAGAGEDWSALVERCVSEGLAGIECLSGIPGRVGATPVQNVGAYGQEVAETVTRIDVWDRAEQRTSVLWPADMHFGYRDSYFKRSSRFVVTGVSFKLRRSQLSGPVRYAELARRLGIGEGERATLHEVAQAVMELRRAKGMVLDSRDPDTRSAGSFFTNPVLSVDAWEALRAVAPAVPGFAAEGGIKVPAAWLVEQAGFRRGYRKGGAAISSKHTLALTVRDGGTASDLLSLAREVHDGVRARFGVNLVPEPVLVGLKF